MQKPIFAKPSMSKKDLFQLVKKNPNAELFVVVDSKKRFLGDITLDDLFLMLLPNEQFNDIGADLAFDMEKKFFAKNAKEIMRKHDNSCNPNEKVMPVALRLAGLEVNEMPVINDKKEVVGVISQSLLIPHLNFK